MTTTTTTPSGSYLMDLRVEMLNASQRLADADLCDAEPGITDRAINAASEALGADLDGLHFWGDHVNTGDAEPATMFALLDTLGLESADDALDVVYAAYAEAWIAEANRHLEG